MSVCPAARVVVIPVAVLLAMGINAVEAAPDVPRRTVAITAAADAATAPDQRSLLHALLEFTALELQESETLDVVERRQLDVAVQELMLQRAQPPDAMPAVELGRILTAEYRIGLKLLPEREEPARRLAQLRIVESRTGAIRGVTLAPCEEDRIEESADEFARYVHNVILSPRGGVVTVAVAPFESLGRFDRLRPLELGLRDLITNRLLTLNGTDHSNHSQEPREITAPAFQVLQRSDLAELIRELDLAQSGLADRDNLPKSLPTRASSHLIRGRLDERTDNEGRKLIVSGEVVSAATGRPIHEFRFETPPEDLLDALTASVDRMVTVLSQRDLQIPASARRRERIETEPLLAQTFADLSRLHRRCPIDFGYTDLFVPPSLRGDGRLRTWVNAESPLGRHLLRKSVDRLESILYVQPSNSAAALGLGFTESFHLEGIYQPSHAAEMLRKAYELDRDGQMGACALKLLPEISFHHNSAQLDRGQEQVTAERAWHALQNMPEEYRDGRWSRLLDLATTALVQAQEFPALIELLKQAAPYAVNAQVEHRYQLAMSIRRMAVAIGGNPDSKSHAVAIEILRNWTDSPDDVLAQVAARGLAQIAEGNKLPLQAAKWYRFAADRLADNDNVTDHLASENLTMHAVRNYRAAKQLEEAVSLLTTMGPPSSGTSLNRGQYGLELGQCYEELNRLEEALAAYVATAEASPGIVDNSDIVARITRLGGVPLRDDRDIDVRRVAGPQGIVHIGGAMTTDGQRLFIGHGPLVTQTEHPGLLAFDTVSETWSRLAPDAGVVTALACEAPWLWIGTATQGVRRCNLASEKWTRWSTEEGLPDPHVQALALDRNPTQSGVVYIAVGNPGSGGLVRITVDDQLQTFDDPLAPDVVPTHLVVTGDRLLARTLTAIHEYHFETQAWTRQEAVVRHRVARPLAPELFPGRNRVWASNYGRELFIYEGSDEENRHLQSAWFPDGQVRAGYRLSFVHQRGADIWFGGDAWERFQSSGLYRLKSSTGDLTKYGPRDGFDPRTNRVHAGEWIGERLWLLTSVGLQVVTPRK